MSSHASPAPAAADTVNFYAALMRFPYEEWIPAAAAAAHVEDVGLPRETLRLVIRTGRRRGLLRTRREPDRLGFYVMRVVEELRTPAATLA
ncbi:hypothetical protein SAMN05216483_6718 [Streptomyces sp. 2131.1]|uniref:hypothetical protein n=1 Tax=Streptomyces sp. 2131.1 TaxID=1855346 RepID=UPI00089A2B9A|nr:hypothetical protein [Streptomyces sp. 2131.1]SEE83654.1 hypothetical protein SAMN05216483_6718 [Streptomyces sp. 2131.1]